MVLIKDLKCHFGSIIKLQTMNKIQGDRPDQNFVFWIQSSVFFFFFFLNCTQIVSAPASYRSILQMVKPWYDEVRDYAFPYPRDCNPRCPMRCYGPMCTHYTQVSLVASHNSD